MFNLAKFFHFVICRANILIKKSIAKIYVFQDHPIGTKLTRSEIQELLLCFTATVTI